MVRRVTLLVMAAALAFGASIAGAPAVHATTVATLDPAALGNGAGALTLGGSDTAAFNTDTGQVLVDGNAVGGFPVAMNVANTGITAFYLSGIDTAAGSLITATGSHPVGLLVTGDVTIAGKVDASAAGSVAGGQGSGSPGSCKAVPMAAASGGAGGSFASAGGHGGDAGTLFGGGAGPSYGDANLFAPPVFAVGSGGGSASVPNACGMVENGGRGGGGLAIVSLGTVDLSSGTLMSNGVGPTAALCSAGAGGGSGGAAMVVAPRYVDNSATLFALHGGAGANAGSNCQGPAGGGGGGAGGRLTVLTDGNRLGQITATVAPGGSGSAIASPGAAGGAPSTFDGSFVTVGGPATGVAATPITFTASVAVGQVSSYTWNFGDGTVRVTTTGSVKHQFRHAGSYAVTATATMTESGTTSAASTSISVSDQPVGGLAATNDGPTPDGARTTLTAKHTSGTGKISYGWDFGDGHTGHGATTTHHYAAPGTYTATVTATNSAGPAFASTTVVVQDPVLSIADASVAEGTAPLPSGGHFTMMRFTLSLTAPTDQSVTVTATTSDGTAVAPRDYKAKTVTVTVAPGHRTASFEVNVVPDSRVEPDETFTVTLSNPSGASLGDATATGTVLNDD
jgi:PKD repeat protein